MRTQSAWGKAPQRVYNVMKYFEQELGRDYRVCIIGCSDGKFVFPFIRRGHRVTAFEIDNVALDGGHKVFPQKRSKVEKLIYTTAAVAPKYQPVATERQTIPGLIKRLEMEKFVDLVNIRRQDFYRSNLTDTFDLVFTSCSIQYKSNRDISLEKIMIKLKQVVDIGGYLYMDYMMPLQDDHTFKSELFLRTGQVKSFFSNSHWEIKHCYEQKTPDFEAAHIDRPEDHFHRFGFIFARRLS